MNLNLQNKRVVVTGSSRGLGLETARTFLSEGARVLICARDQSALEKVYAGLVDEYGDAAVGLSSGDLSEDSGIEQLVAAVKTHFDELDILVCNVGSGRSVPTLEEDMLEWERMMSINFYTSVKCIDALKPLMMSESKETAKSITIINSIVSAESLGAATTYCAAKSALLAHTKCISDPLAKQGIRVNSVSPGNMLFPGSTWEYKMKHNPELVDTILEYDVSMQRFGSVDEVARVVAFISSPAASFVCGANWVVDGGQLRAYT